MKLSEFKKTIQNLENLTFIQTNGEVVPLHFHITEIGLTIKHFIDCGNVIHKDKYANMQIWVAKDFEHRLHPSKLSKIINQSEKLFDGEDLELEIEYQTDTIGKYGVEYENGEFKLQVKKTDCLASVKCDLPQAKIKVNLSELVKNETETSSCCNTNTSCC